MAPGSGPASRRAEAGGRRPEAGGERGPAGWRVAAGGSTDGQAREGSCHGLSVEFVAENVTSGSAPGSVANCGQAPASWLGSRPREFRAIGPRDRRFESVRPASCPQLLSAGRRVGARGCGVGTARPGDFAAPPMLCLEGWHLNDREFCKMSLKGEGGVFGNYRKSQSRK